MRQGSIRDFSGQLVYVGLDVSVKHWSVKILGDQIDRKPFTHSPDPDLFAAFLRSNYPGAEFLIGYEAGYTGFWAAHRLNDHGLRCVVLNPADVPTTDKQKRQKTDSRDCIKIADALKDKRVTPIHIPSPTTVEDRQLIRTRAGFIVKQTRTKNQIKALLVMHGLHEDAPANQRWSQAHIAWLRSLAVDRPSLRFALDMYLDELASIRSTIARLTLAIRKLALSEQYEHNAALVDSVPGFDVIGAMTFLTEAEDVRFFRNVDHLASFIGLIPTTYSSGAKEHVGSITPRGRDQLKSTFIEAAWVAIRRDPELTAAFEALCVRMKKTLAIIRIARKLAARVHHVLRTRELYRYENKKYVNEQVAEVAPNV